MENKKILIIDNEFIGKRIDSTISELSNNISRSQVQKLISKNLVFFNGLIVNDPSKKVSYPGEIIINLDLDISQNYEISPENIDLDIVYEDDYIIVINKKAGMVCHPAPGHKSGTLVNALMYHFKNNLSDLGGSLRPGIVHRLDKDTSGLMLVAKTNESHNAFANLFLNEKGKLIKRKYTCFVFGTPFEKSKKIETGIIRHPKFRQMYTTSENHGKKSITLYNVLRTKYFTSTKSISEINCELLTGRTHQIRVHMKYIGHPIIGDPVYGKSKIENTYPENIRKFPHQALHSRELSFFHPFIKKHQIFERLPEFDLI